MKLTKEPVKKAPWPPLRSNDVLHRWPERHRVGGKGTNWRSISRATGVRARDLVYYNFRTRKSKEINWYLENYVGCLPPGPGRKHYSFAGAPYDEKANTGCVFIPRFGNPIKAQTDRFGNKVVENYSKSHTKEPGGACYAVAFSRIRQSSNEVGGTIPAWDNKSDFGRLWGSLIRPKKSWLKLPEKYRGKGAAGAVVFKGAGTLVDSVGIWAGKLKPGAVVQTWEDPKDFDRVRDGKSPLSYGHSFVFLNYTYTGAAISGMAIADQGYQNAKPLKKGDYGYWVAANLTI
jgi:hypothetical protein